MKNVPQNVQSLCLILLYRKNVIIIYFLKKAAQVSLVR